MTTKQSTDITQCKYIAAFVSLTSHLIMHQIDVNSAHFSVAFNIPLNNISIYFSKLFSFRCLLIAIGSAAEFIIAQVCNISKGSGKDNCRKYISVTCFSVVLLLRFIFLLILQFSRRLGYYVYIILSVEAFFFGYFHCSVLAITPEYAVPVVFAANASRLFVLGIQLILDLCLSKRSLVMIKVQSLICFALTSIAVGLWSHCIIGESDKHKQVSSSSGEDNISNFFTTLIKAGSPFMMFFAGSMFKDFLFPGVLPYAVLHRDKCHLINMLVPIANMVGPTSIFALELMKEFREWNTTLDRYWVLVIPMFLIFIYSMLAIHTRIPYARVLGGSRDLVLITTIILILCNSFMDPLSFGGVAKTVKPENGEEKKGSESTPGSNSVITFHLIMALFMRFVFSKLSVGYNDTRVKLGYHLPKFRPKHRMSRSNLRWYIIRQTFKRGFKDTGNDFRMNIQQYL